MDVAISSPTVKENLPLLFVHYPEHYGTFFTFSENENDQTYYCSCCKPALSNYFLLNNLKDYTKYSSSFGANNYVFFKDKICHRCNLATPTLTWCHPMYGGIFKQYHGWYISQNEYKLGYKTPFYECNEQLMPDHVSVLIKEIKSLEIDRKSVSFPASYEIEKLIAKKKRKIDNIVEDLTREEFGHKKIGEGLISESILHKILIRIFPNEDIKRHLRPEWLEFLELDIFIPNLKLAFEYQGQQHFIPIKIWGGQKSLDNQKMRDRRKKQLCVSNNITLIEINYTEPLDEDYIRQKTNQIIKK